MREKKSEFMGQFRVTPGQKAKIRAMLKFYQRDRRQMAFEVMDALFYHCDHKDQLAFPLRFVSDRVIIDTVVSKYADYVPIYRQSAILKRETGIDLSRATLDSWVMRVGELLHPITAAMGQELLNGTYLQADETTVGVQMHDGRGKNHQAYLWQYSRPRGPAVFDS